MFRYIFNPVFIHPTVSIGTADYFSTTRLNGVHPTYDSSTTFKQLYYFYRIIFYYLNCSVCAVVRQYYYFVRLSCLLKQRLYTLLYPPFFVMRYDSNRYFHVVKYSKTLRQMVESFILHIVCSVVSVWIKQLLFILFIF